jgi:hypothetical protein
MGGGRNMLNALGGLYVFYRDGFRRMTLGRTLWKIIIVKLVVMFAVLKLFFFPDYLQSNFQTDEQRADHVLEQITRQADQTNQDVSGSVSMNGLPALQDLVRKPLTTSCGREFKVACREPFPGTEQ